MNGKRFRPLQGEAAADVHRKSVAGDVDRHDQRRKRLAAVAHLSEAADGAPASRAHARARIR